MKDGKHDPTSPIIAVQTNKNQARERRVVVNLDEYRRPPDSHGSGRVRRSRGQKKIVKLLNADDAGVRNVPGLQFLQPLNSNLGSSGNFGPRQGGGSQKFESALKDGLGHDASLGKTLPKSSGRVPTESETLYLDWPVIFSRMRSETLDNVSAVLAANSRNLKQELGLSNADILGKDGKNVSNIIREANDPRVSTVARMAHSLGIETWQILVDELPRDRELRAQLAHIVRGFVKLGPKLRETMLRNVENEARGQHRTSEIFGSPLPKASGSD